MKKKIVDWVQQTLNGLKNESKKKIVSLGLIGIILLSAVSFSLFDAMFGPKKVTPAELVDIVFEKYDLEYQEAWQYSDLFDSFEAPECYKCKPKSNVKKSDLEQEFAVVGVISDVVCVTFRYSGEEIFSASIDTDKKINDSRFSGNFFSVGLGVVYLPSDKKDKDYKIRKNNREVLKNIHKGDKIKIKFKLKNIDQISTGGEILIMEDWDWDHGYSRITVEKYY